MDLTEPRSAAETPRPPDFPFHGQIVVFTGNLASLGLPEAQALVQRLGGGVADEVTAGTTMLVVGGASAVGGDLPPSPPGQRLKLRHAEQINAATPGSVQIVPEEEFCRLGGVPSLAALDRHYHSVRQIRERYPAVREDHLRYLEKWALVRSVARTKTDRYYRFQDLRIVRQVSEELESGVSFRVVLRALVAARDGQLTLDFNQRLGEAQPAKLVALTPRRGTGVVPPAVANASEGWATASAKQSLAAKYFHEGAALDDGDEEDQERARFAYRKSLLLDPNLVPALVNLANLHYAHDELVEAQALYERAMHLDGECFEAYFNLGNIHHDLGRYLDALEHYRVAIAINRAYPDAHFYLAVTLEKIGHSAEARAHWRAYRDLAPGGEWVELAKEFSE